MSVYPYDDFEEFLDEQAGEYFDTMPDEFEEDEEGEDLTEGGAQ